MKHITSPNIEDLKPNQVFVFGSNEAGRHGAGAARYANKHFGFRNNQGFGFHSNCFAIPTKDWDLNTLPISVISFYVQRFVVFARKRPELTFLVTEIGCGLAGYTPTEIAPLFSDAIEVNNIHLPQSFWYYYETD